MIPTCFFREPLEKSVPQHQISRNDYSIAAAYRACKALVNQPGHVASFELIWSPTKSVLCSSLIPQCDHRVHPGRAPGREAACRQARSRHHGHHTRQRDRIMWRHAQIWLAISRAIPRLASNPAATPDAISRSPIRNTMRNTSARPALTPSDPDLVRLPRDRVRDHAVNAHRHQDQSHACENAAVRLKRGSA